jgi:hypothetical protein
LGTTLTVALIETVMSRGNAGAPAAFAAAQSFAFFSLVPLAALAIVVTLVGRKLAIDSGVRAQDDRDRAGDDA